MSSKRIDQIDPGSKFNSQLTEAWIPVAGTSRAEDTRTTCFILWVRNFGWKMGKMSDFAIFERSSWEDGKTYGKKNYLRLLRGISSFDRYQQLGRGLRRKISLGIRVAPFSRNQSTLRIFLGKTVVYLEKVTVPCETFIFLLSHGI